MIGNTDLFGGPVEQSLGSMPLVPGILGATSSLTALLYDIMVHITSDDRVWGSDSDLYILKRLYSRLVTFEESLPDRFRPESNPVPSTYLLKCVTHHLPTSPVHTFGG